MLANAIGYSQLDRFVFFFRHQCCAMVAFENSGISRGFEKIMIWVFTLRVLMTDIGVGLWGSDVFGV